MRRGPKPAKSKEAKPPVARRSSRDDGARVRDLEKRLAEAQEQLRTRDRELAESQEQQTATAEILRIISSSPADVQPVLEAVAENAAHLCESFDSSIFRRGGDRLFLVAHYGPIPFGRVGEFAIPLTQGSLVGRSIIEHRAVQVTDLQAETEEFPLGAATARQFGYRTSLAVPLLRESAEIGAISIRRTEVRPFTERQVALLKTFADQAVIAIENVRLFTETKEALEQQTATSDILRVISSSPTDVQPVFDTIASSAARLCETYDVFIRVLESEDLRLVAHHGPIPASALIPVVRGSVSGRVVLERRTIHVDDIQGAADEFPEGATLGREFGHRTNLGVPLLREGMPLGAIVMRRAEVKPFTDKEIALLKIFADQAVIAIENVRLFNELQEKNQALTQAHAQVSEALEQQTATADILRVISSSPTDVQPVFNELSSHAARLCEANDAVIFRLDGEILRIASSFGGEIPLSSEASERGVPVSRGTVIGRAVIEQRAINIPDLVTELDTEYPQSRVYQQATGMRSVLAVPLVRGEVAAGAILVRRLEVRRFTDSHIALLQTFADQAVIALENVRLFTELQEKNRALTQAHAQVSEALEQQTATAEILRAISSSPTDVQPVFDVIAANAARLCVARDAQVLRVEGDVLRLVSAYGSPSMPSMRAISRGHAVGRAVIDRQTIHVRDMAQAVAEFPETSSPQHGVESLVAVPLLREGVAIGVIRVSRTQIQPFTEQQIALLKTFADQAVIAIENVRLFKELEARNRDLTATGEILQVISRSPTDTQPVFDTIADNAVKLFKPWSVAVYRFDGEFMHVAAVRGGRPGSEQYLRDQGGRRPTRDVMAGRCVIDRTIIHVSNFEADSDIPPAAREIARVRGFGATISVPMLRDGEPIGVISVSRAETGPFSQAEIDLLRTFADQAVIAIENVRLFKELEARTQDLTRSVGELQALSEVGQAISSTLDLEAVLSTIAARATQLSGTDAGVIYEYDELREVFVPRATEHLEATIVETMLATPVRKGEGATGQLAELQEPIQVPDILAAPAESRVRGALVRAGYRALLAVPLVREGHLLGGLTVIRKATGAFAPEVIDLLRTFATQSVLAIQNARLFREIEEKSRQLEVASQHKSEFLANMSHELRTPLNAIIGFSEVLSERMFGELNEKQEEYSNDIHASGQHLLSLINDILDLSKIEAGRMELELSDFDLPTAIDNALTLVRERAARRDITLEKSVDPRLGQVRADERKVRQIVLNLLSNAIKFTPEGGRIEVGAVPRGGLVEVSVSDTGVGIAPEDREAVFEEFRQVGTADKKVEGTGLGLTLCRKFVELHGGRIWVESEVGMGSTFTFSLPPRNA